MPCRPDRDVDRVVVETDEHVVNNGIGHNVDTRRFRFRGQAYQVSRGQTDGERRYTTLVGKSAGEVGRREFESRLRPPEGRRIPSYPTGPHVELSPASRLTVVIHGVRAPSVSDECRERSVTTIRIPEEFSELTIETYSANHAEYTEERAQDLIAPSEPESEANRVSSGKQSGRDVTERVADENSISSTRPVRYRP